MQKTFNLTIRIDKKDSAFFYFILESNENLVFFSTLDFKKGQLFRDIELTGHISFKEEVYRILDFLKSKIDFTYLK